MPKRARHEGRLMARPPGIDATLGMKRTPPAHAAPSERALRRTMSRLSAHWSAEEIERYFTDPVFIVSTPRSGSTLLFTMLASTPGVWTIAGESHGVYAQFPHLRAEDEAMTSGRLLRRHADPETCENMRLIYIAMLTDMSGRRFYDEIARDRGRRILFLEKTPRNALNIEFLLEVFPSARFIFLHRDPRENIASIMEGWMTGEKTGQFVTFTRLPGWPREQWCFILPPGWKALAGMPLADIAAFQWRACNSIILEDLSKLDLARWTSVDYAELVADPHATLERLCDFCGVPMGEYLQMRDAANLPISASTVTPPKKDKWRRHESEILRVLPDVEGVMEKLAQLPH